MPLLDHFHAPLFPLHPWESFHVRWATAIADYLDRIMPRRYFATVQTHLGTQVEADVAEFERPAEAEEETGNGASGGLAVATWAPPAATLVIPAIFPDEVEIQVIDQRDDARLVAVVELISPRNKDRGASRRAFAIKCGSYLQRGIGLVMVDTVTNRQGNLHNELVQLMEMGEPFTMPAAGSLYAVAYRPARRQDTNQIDVWPVSLTLGGPLPLLPLALRGTRAIPLDLEATYTDARERCRL